MGSGGGTAPAGDEGTLGGRCMRGFRESAERTTGAMAKNAGYRILMLRSGSTQWDREARVQGATDLPISEAGEAQVRGEVATLGRPPIAAVICGPDEASVATARILAEAAGVRVNVVPELTEVHLGLWEGILKSELEDRFCRAGRRWDEDPACVTPPEGETLEAFMARLLPALRKALGRIRGRRSATQALAGVEGTGVGVVLRPFADALVRCVLSGRASTDLCSVVETRPPAQWFEVRADHPWELAVGAKAAAPASAA